MRAVLLLAATVSAAWLALGVADGGTAAATVESQLGEAEAGGGGEEPASEGARKEGQGEERSEGRSCADRLRVLEGLLRESPAALAAYAAELEERVTVLDALRDLLVEELGRRAWVRALREKLRRWWPGG